MLPAPTLIPSQPMSSLWPIRLRADAPNSILQWMSSRTVSPVLRCIVRAALILRQQVKRNNSNPSAIYVAGGNSSDVDRRVKWVE